MSKQFATSAVEVLSAASVTAGAFVWNVAAGLVTLGAFGLLFARGVAR